MCRALKKWPFKFHNDRICAPQLKKIWYNERRVVTVKETNLHKKVWNDAENCSFLLSLFSSPSSTFIFLHALCLPLYFLSLHSHHQAWIQKKIIEGSERKKMLMFPSQNLPLPSKIRPFPFKIYPSQIHLLPSKIYPSYFFFISSFFLAFFLGGRACPPYPPVDPRLFIRLVVSCKAE